MVVIVVVASVMVYAWSTGLLTSLLVQPTAGKEDLRVDSYSFRSGVNLTVYFRNAGSLGTTLQTYYVKDAVGDSYQLTSWTGPSINPTQVISTNILIGASCGGCVLTGNAFTFTAGSSYTVQIVTSRNNPFPFTVNM